MVYIYPNGDNIMGCFMLYLCIKKFPKKLKDIIVSQTIKCDEIKYKRSVTNKYDFNDTKWNWDPSILETNKVQQ